MLGQHWVRFGVMGAVARFVAADAQRFARGTRVICRTPRGLEVAEVLSEVDPFTGPSSDAPPMGSLLRPVTVEDDLLLARLEKHKHEAFEACQQELMVRGIPAVLVDVEHLFDGQSLMFYFVGDSNPELDALTAELAETYDARVQFTKFADALTTGCGPGCGTADAEGSGCGTGGCSTCSVLSACGTKRTVASTSQSS